MEYFPRYFHFDINQFLRTIRKATQQYGARLVLICFSAVSQGPGRTNDKGRIAKGRVGATFCSRARAAIVSGISGIQMVEYLSSSQYDVAFDSVCGFIG
jgi:hypothetical protein